MTTGSAHTYRCLGGDPHELHNKLNLPTICHTITHWLRAMAFLFPQSLVEISCLFFFGSCSGGRVDKPRPPKCSTSRADGLRGRRTGQRLEPGFRISSPPWQRQRVPSPLTRLRRLFLLLLLAICWSVHVAESLSTVRKDSRKHGMTLPAVVLARGVRTGGFALVWTGEGFEYPYLAVGVSGPWRQ